MQFASTRRTNASSSRRCSLSRRSRLVVLDPSRRWSLRAWGIRPSRAAASLALSRTRATIAPTTGPDPARVGILVRVADAYDFERPMDVESHERPDRDGRRPAAAGALTGSGRTAA